MSAAPKAFSRTELTVPVYVYELPVRITHWLVVLATLILAATGYYIGHPFVAVTGHPRDHFFMGTVRVIHLYTAIVFSLAVFLRIYWMFVGNRYARWDEFIPISRERLRNTWEAIKFFSFVRRDPLPYPGQTGTAGLAYAAVFLIQLMMILTGLTMYTVYAPSESVFQNFRFLIPIFGGLPIAHLIHHIGMWLLLIFIILHVYLVVLFSVTERSAMDAMLSGYKEMKAGPELENRDG
jgi:Ni/Fe-hydrogenase 1 B-type cytochrome subunit